ncbi:MAG TPA: hypothetical protein VFW49_09235 [Fluviicoccus sp.]|nr:hypothetical protein [Fluviicoccus sp.]
MKKTVLSSSIALVLVAAGMTGCSRGPLSESTPAAGVATAGKVVDGYVSGSTVTLDVNDDRICSAGEPTTTTDAEGNFNFSPRLGSHMTCASGGIDLSSGLPLVGELTAPPGATTITPLTSLVMVQINAANPPVLNQATPVSADAASFAQNAVATSLGLPAGIDLLTADPIASAATTPELLKTTAAIQTLMVQTAKLIEEAATGGSSTPSADSSLTNALFANAMLAVANTIKTSPVTTATIGNLAESVVKAAAETAATNPVVTAAAPSISTLSPASVAAFAAPALEAMATSIVSATSAELLTQGAANPMTVAQANESLSNTVGSLADILLTQAAGSISGVTLADLEAIAAATFTVSETGAVSTAPVADIVTVINAEVPTVTVPADVTAELANANILTNAVAIKTYGFNCLGTGAVSTRTGCIAKDVTGALNKLSIELDTPNGNAVQGGTAAANPVVPGVTVAAGTAQTSNVTIVIQPANSTQADQRTLTLSLDGVTFYQGNVGAGTTTVAGILPVNGSVVVTGTKVAGTAIAEARVAAANVISFDPATKSVDLDIAALRNALPAGYASLTDLTGSYVINAVFPGLSLSTGTTAAPVRAKVVSIPVTLQ